MARYVFPGGQETAFNLDAFLFLTIMEDEDVVGPPRYSIVGAVAVVEGPVLLVAGLTKAAAIAELRRFTKEANG